MSLTTAQYEALADQIELILQTPGAASQVKDEKVRCRLAEGGRKLGISFEEPGDTLRRFGYMHFQLPLVCIGVESGVFKALTTEPERTFTNVELAEKTGVNSKLLKRLLRYYQSLSMIAQLEDDGYKANNVSQVLGIHDYGSTIRFFQRVIAPASIMLPDFLKQHGYGDPTGVSPNSWNIGQNTDLHPFAWTGQTPWAMELFLPYMNIQREGRPAFFDVLDFATKFAQGATGETPLFIDVGGSMGAQCVEFRKRYPNLTGRVILQDLPTVIEQVKSKPLSGSERIETQPYDFFTPEPIKGARAYYLRNVLHDWPDAKCVEILGNVKAGMTEQSVILIDETVLSENGAPWRATQHDMEMMTIFGAQERTLAEWTSLFEEAGLNIREVVRYSEEYEDSLLILELK
ncbi:S-adenosyl-L-methionine-dependent methyltransferase [Daldinia caldariorum]|uniref:S-adenosyl-L-methionine-dependent methyltransferase n=1 Tax=Daldinia caldariorum TaxID=326644 RepID=UPI0020088312|nr:S-adenosyl-L-methionine-dependent methyltransferase [Daldinia caldariorum]KAI1465560.1 S-adenosyl-L-methionine-dependent methyltransferase [Daldinia caldariorum]